MIQNGLFLEYRVEGSTGPGQVRAASERLTFREQSEGLFEVQIEAEEVQRGLYADAYGDPILVNAGFVASNGRPLQFHGHCPFFLTPSQRRPAAEVAWPWDGAGVEPMPYEPEQQLIVRASVEGPARWKKWNAWVLRRTDVPASAPSPTAYYDQASGLLVGVEYGADFPGAGRFVFCDAELKATNAGGL